MKANVSYRDTKLCGVCHYNDKTTLDIFDLLAFLFARPVIPAPNPLPCASAQLCFKHCLEVSLVIAWYCLLIHYMRCCLMINRTIHYYEGKHKNGFKVDILVPIKEFNIGLPVHSWSQLTHPVEISLSYCRPVENVFLTNSHVAFHGVPIVVSAVALQTAPDSSLYPFLMYLPEPSANNITMRSSAIMFLFPFWHDVWGKGSALDCGGRAPRPGERVSIGRASASLPADRTD